MNVATASVLNITELTRVDDDRELVGELFSIFKSVFPSHLQRLSDAVANEVPRQVEVERHTLISNDTHGHLIGDEVLKEAARRLLLSVRSHDYVGRYGGEEFLIILNNCDPASTPRRAVRRKYVRLCRITRSKPAQGRCW